nr:DUF6055 domain-containing protein [uncultured Draconibacterium sp.]
MSEQKPFFHKTIVYILCICAAIFQSCSNEPKIEKELYIPENIYKVPEGNDFSNPESEYSYKHMTESDNFALFWAKEYGDDPMANPDATKRFDPKEAIEECERFYNYYVDELKIVEKGNSLTDQYKMLIIVFGGDEATAFGGGEEDTAGMLWTPAVRINKKPYGALAHELAHSFQYVSNADAGTGPNGPIMEMAAQYSLWQVYPEWMTFENYHLVDFMKQTNYAFLHPINMYHSPYVLEYWSQIHGKDFLGKIYRNTLENEDPVTTYKRITETNQEKFNDEMFDASRRFITWDLDRVQEVAHQYANQHQSRLVPVANGWYKITAENCPQNYGYNGIQLNVPEAGTAVVLNFKGIAGADGYNAVKADKAGWRYGFVASLKDGSRVYGEMQKDKESSTSFTVPANTEYLWLVVMGAPTEHWPIVMHWGNDAEETPEENWPYQIKLEGTTLAANVIG